MAAPSIVMPSGKTLKTTRLLSAWADEWPASNDHGIHAINSRLKYVIILFEQNFAEMKRSTKSHESTRSNDTKSFVLFRVTLWIFLVRVFSWIGRLLKAFVPRSSFFAKGLYGCEVAASVIRSSSCAAG